jgi:hypothetical protein
VGADAAVSASRNELVPRVIGVGKDGVMRCQHVDRDSDTQCRMDAVRRVLVASGDPPDPDQTGFTGTVYLVQVCKEHDPDPRQSRPIPRPPGPVPISERPRR